MTTRATIRTYRHGLGDCHLVTLRKGTHVFRLLIDCGVILGTQDAGAVMRGVCADVVEASGGKVDVLVVTHAHWDHASGFVQAADVFEGLEVGQVWMAWTENDQDPDAQSLGKSRRDSLALLQGASGRMSGLAASDGVASPPLFETLAEFLGMAAGTSTSDLMQAARDLGKGRPVRYCDPADAPVDLPDVDARVYVLGPPRDVSALKRMDPSKADLDETYRLASAAISPSPGAGLFDAGDAPFSPLVGIPFDAARQMDFFRSRYFDSSPWRRIDGDWIEGAANELALALDNMVNNTSLVLAIELAGKDVLLFAADAQVGNWMSWSGCTWHVGARGHRAAATVTGDDLLAKTVFYKVGHHGSHNATLKAGGVEKMTRLRSAVIPVDHDMAVKRKWGALPLASLVAALGEATSGKGGAGVLRTDARTAPPSAPGLSWEEKYVEVEVRSPA